MKVETRERIYLWEGKVYMLRDILLNGKSARVEYAAIDSEGAVTWKPTRGGVLFSEIEPIAPPPAS